MGLFTNRARLRAILIGGALVATLAVPAAASADTTPGGVSIAPASSNGATISVSADVHVLSRVVATVEISFTCDPFLVYNWETGETVETTSGRLEYGTAAIVQASGRSIATGSADFYGGGDVLCDGATVHTRSVPIVASTMPWKPGGAVVGASIAVVDSTYQESDTASSGPVAVKLTK